MSEELGRLRSHNISVATTAWNDLYREFAPRLRARAANLGCEDQADDIVQDVFTKLFEDRFADTAITDPLAYLMRCVQNHANNHHRRRTTQFGAPAQLPDGELPGSDRPSPRARAIQTEKHEKLRNAVDQLPDNMRRFVMLFYFRGLEYSEVASELGMSRGALGVLHMRARKRMNELLGGASSGG